MPLCGAVRQGFSRLRTRREREHTSRPRRVCQSSSSHQPLGQVILRHVPKPQLQRVRQIIGGCEMNAFFSQLLFACLERTCCKAGTADSRCSPSNPKSLYFLLSLLNSLLLAALRPKHPSRMSDLAIVGALDQTGKQVSKIHGPLRQRVESRE
jgi:hypothetical protein